MWTATLQTLQTSLLSMGNIVQSQVYIHVRKKPKGMELE
jgi:hypothetical protein